MNDTTSIDDLPGVPTAINAHGSGVVQNMMKKKKVY